VGELQKPLQFTPQHLLLLFPLRSFVAELEQTLFFLSLWLIEENFISSRQLGNYKEEVHH